MGHCHGHSHAYIAPRGHAQATSEVERRRAKLVLGRGAAWESRRVLSAFRMLAARLNFLASLLTSEVERRRARLVLGWGAPGKTLGCCRFFGCSLQA
jgi:hypothetical protein